MHAQKHRFLEEISRDVEHERHEVAAEKKKIRKGRHARKRARKREELTHGLMKSEHVGFKRLSKRVKKEYMEKGVPEKKAEAIGAKVAGKVKSMIARAHGKKKKRR